MTPRVKKIVLVAVGLVVLVAAGVAKRLLAPRAETEAQRQERLAKDVRKSIDKSFEGFKLCPLSDPDCNTRK